ncbi:MAG: hypothetical protein JWM46_613 [Candidatus Kaiserbacteria bacterium]|nr:hypothetical protein [Candidatus Kaiserbacteria bacterium]
MNTERSILIAFLGNYLTNTVVAALVALVPAAATPGIFTAQYISYVVLAAVVVAILTWWYLKVFTPANALRAGIIFGAVGFVVALVTAFVTGISGVLTQTGSLSQMFQVIPNFWPFIASWSTLALLLYWMVPAAAIGWWKSRSHKAAPMM